MLMNEKWGKSIIKLQLEIIAEIEKELVEEDPKQKEINGIVNEYDECGDADDR